eukprot:TRINITY_DN23755_c0_g2_i1.p1 TRINITY_DN23755_c0_g2~~TRINITY_DN23755_c0_g2_i1.p1  ORF type:complete len:448 (-),score=79.16 TRINITY_DN23755_c0_g2_i1:32-1375(-)
MSSPGQDPKGGDRMTQAVNMERKARELEAAGQAQEALHQYNDCLQVFKYVWKWESNPRVKEMLYERIEDLVGRAEKLKSGISSGTVAPSGAPPGGGYSGATATQAPPATGEDAEDKEKERLRKGLEGAIMTSKPNVKWDDVAGLEAAKGALQETVILPTKYPQLFTGKRVPWHGILLYGPPGTGKSHLARACATEADATFFSISSADLVSKWMGESEKLTRSLFEMARESKPSIVFIDEVDSLCGARGESGESDAARRIKTEFLAQMDGVGKDSSSVLVLGATNTPWDLDAAIRRRFEKRIYIPLPDLEARVRLLEIHLGDTPHAISPEDLREIGARTEGFSGADISILTRDALFEPVRRIQRAKTFQRVTKAGPDGAPKQYWTPCSPGAEGAVEKTLMQVPADELLPPNVLLSDYEAALEKTRPSVSQKDLKVHEEFTQTYGMEGQ